MAPLLCSTNWTLYLLPLQIFQTDQVEPVHSLIQISYFLEHHCFIKINSPQNPSYSVMHFIFFYLKLMQFPDSINISIGLSVLSNLLLPVSFKIDSSLNPLIQSCIFRSPHISVIRNFIRTFIFKLHILINVDVALSS